MNRISEVSFCLWTCKWSLLTHGTGSAWTRDYRLLSPSKWQLRGQGNAAAESGGFCTPPRTPWSEATSISSCSAHYPQGYGHVIQQLLECHWNWISEVNSLIYGLSLVRRSRLLGSPEALYKIRKAIMELKLSNILTSYIFHFFFIQYCNSFRKTCSY